MADETEPFIAQLRRLEGLAQSRAAYRERRYPWYERVDNVLIWLSGITAGLAGVSAVVEAGTVVTVNRRFRLGRLDHRGAIG